jgi:putative oxidoreductase
MKHIPTIAAALLALVFAGLGGAFLLGLFPEQPAPPEGTPVAHFMHAFAPTGYMTFVKVLEVIGGVLVALPKTRRLGVVVLAPIVVNIVAFHVFVAGGTSVLDPMVLGVCALLGIVAWSERAAFRAMLP